jgi:hypothetical protein
MRTRKNNNHRGGGITNWLWGVTDVVSLPKPLAATGKENQAVHTVIKGGKKKQSGKKKQGGKKKKQGGLSAQLVPIGLTLANLFTGTKKKRRYPRKGMLSKSRKGRLDFVTHKGNKLYNRSSKRQKRNSLGVIKRPY